MSFFITGDWNTKVGRQEIPVVTGRFGLGEHNDAGQRLKEFFQENTLHWSKQTFFPSNTRIWKKGKITIEKNPKYIKRF